ncbi:MAG TPA: hypothetical protein VGX48_08930 [Pyrinomonadaceae bacterium]|nr:hypothetical protein [Pyrinomonadaceae bacterium]
MLAKTLLVAALCTTVPDMAAAWRLTNVRPRGARVKTEWRVVPSLKFDALCFLNVLTGDEFYRRFYRDEYARFAPLLTPAARDALRRLKRKLKDENKVVIPAFLSLHFSAADDRTLDEMLLTLDKTESMKNNLRRTVYFTEGGWRLFMSVRSELRTILASLKEMGFADYWGRHVLPRLTREAALLEGRLAEYDVAAEVEAHLGFALPSNRITVYLLYFARPHGIRVTGSRFLADVSYPFLEVLRNAVHEMLHPPFDASRDRELRVALKALEGDAFLMGVVRRHNPSFGYNSFDGFVEEDCVRALEQVIGERLKIARDAGRRWAEEDDGIHVFAAVLYGMMRRENYDGSREPFRDFLLRMLKTGRLAPGKIQQLYQSFYPATRPG